MSICKLDKHFFSPKDRGSLTRWDVTIVPSFIGVSCVAPGPLFVVGASAVILLVTQCTHRVFVRGLTVPALALVSGLCKVVSSKVEFSLWVGGRDTFQRWCCYMDIIYMYTTYKFNKLNNLNVHYTCIMYYNVIDF